MDDAGERRQNCKVMRGCGSGDPSGAGGLFFFF